MAIIVAGRTICRLCGKPLSKGEQMVAFSPFILNEVDPLFQFNDAAYHDDCFRRHPLATLCLATFDEVRDKFGPGNRCAQCQSEILHPDECFTFGCLTSNVNSSLRKYNCVQLHRACLPKWEPLEMAYAELVKASNDGTLVGPGVRRLLAELEKQLRVVA